MNNYIIRKFKTDDISSVYSLLKASFGMLANPLDTILGLIFSRGLVYILEIDNKIEGCLFLIKILDVAYIFNGCISENYRDQKIAQCFLTTDLLNICKENKIKLIIAAILEDNKICQAAVNHIGMKYSEFKINLPFQGKSHILYKWV